MGIQFIILISKYENLMINIDSPLIELYPIKFEYEKTCKKFEWMYEPILPPININLILEHIY